MFTHDPRSAKVSKGFESPNLQGVYRSEQSSELQEHGSALIYSIGDGAFNTGVDFDWSSPLYCLFKIRLQTLDSLLLECHEVGTATNPSSVTKIVFARSLEAIPLTYLPTYRSHRCSDFVYLVLVVLEQDELPSSVGLDFRARLDGGRMYSRHLEAKRLP
ncbi:hypothetical protein Tco_0997148 [Tanacetum coccineum]